MRDDRGVPLARAARRLGELDPDDRSRPVRALERTHVDGRQFVDGAAQRQARDGHRAERSAGQRAERSSGKASEPRRTPSCSSARPGSTARTTSNSALAAPLGAGRRCAVRATTRGGSSGTWSGGEAAIGAAGARRSPARSPHRVRRRRGWRAGERRRPPPRARAGRRRRGRHGRAPGAALSPVGGSRRRWPASSARWISDRGRERMALADEEQEVLGEQRFDGELRLVHRQVHDRRVVLAEQQRRDQRRRAALGDDDAHLGMAGRHLGEQAGEEPARRRPEHAEADVADDVAVTLGHLGGDVVELAQDPPRPLDDPGAVVGEPAVGAVDELGAELLLQAGDVAGDVRLHREQGAGGGRERAVVGDRDQGGELANVHRRHDSLPSPKQMVDIGMFVLPDGRLVRILTST